MDGGSGKAAGQMKVFRDLKFRQLVGEGSFKIRNPKLSLEPWKRFMPESSPKPKLYYLLSKAASV